MLWEITAFSLSSPSITAMMVVTSAANMVLLSESFGGRLSVSSFWKWRLMTDAAHTLVSVGAEFFLWSWVSRYSFNLSWASYLVIMNSFALQRDCVSLDRNHVFTADRWLPSSGDKSVWHWSLQRHVWFGTYWSSTNNKCFCISGLYIFIYKLVESRAVWHTAISCPTTRNASCDTFLILKRHISNRHQSVESHFVFASTEHIIRLGI